MLLMLGLALFLSSADSVMRCLPETEVISDCQVANTFFTSSHVCVRVCVCMRASVQNLIRKLVNCSTVLCLCVQRGNGRGQVSKDLHLL